ncbi:MAG: ABC transporter ATP-binding protein [Candidatus Heimdallarchaeota archaeon]|nr:ABC transporter ATP-binding protein [Candidatus Heimdallarchaeota archaeon]
MTIENSRYPGHKKWLWDHSVKEKRLTITYVVAIMISAISGIYTPIIIGDIIDQIIGKQTSHINTSILILVGLALSTSGFHAIYNVLATTWGYKNEKRIRIELFNSLQSKSIEYHTTLDSGKLMSLSTNDMSNISNMYIMTTNLIHNISSITFIIVVLATQLDFYLAACFIPIFPAIIYTFKKYRQRLIPYTDDLLVQYSNMATTLQDSISGAEVVRAYSAENTERGKFYTAVVSFRDTWIGQNYAIAKYFPTLITDVAVGINFLISILFVLQGFITLGTFISINLILMRVRGTLSSFHRDWNSMENALSASSRIFQMIDSESERPEITSSRTIEFQGKIEFRNVTFYHGSNGSTNPVLKNISFIIEPKQRVALVGPTGCGKTTIAKLLLRFYTPQEGEILIDDVNIQELDLKLLRTRLGYIEQDIYIFPNSIRENITFGKPNASEEEIDDVVRMAEIKEFIDEMELGLETKVGDRGVKLSGGQRQRIAIARALLVDPQILILDDASSAIDSSTEERIVKSMERVMRNRTTIVITHRLHAIRSSDKILCLKRGAIVAEGTHGELIDTSSDYRRIFGKQITEVIA